MLASYSRLVCVTYIYQLILMLKAFLVCPLQEGHGCITILVEKYSY